MAIMESDLFKGVSQRFITRIAHGAEEETHKKDSVIFKRGEEAAHFYVLAAGDTRALSLDWERVQQLGRFFPGITSRLSLNLAAVIGRRLACTGPRSAEAAITGG